MDRVSQAPHTLNLSVSKEKSTINEWRSLQLQRAHELFTDVDRDSVTEDELLEKYRKHVLNHLTPKVNEDDPTNSIEQCRDGPFDLNQAYEQAEIKGKELITDMLESCHGYGQPDLATIQEMVHHGQEQSSRVTLR